MGSDENNPAGTTEVEQKAVEENNSADQERSDEVEELRRIIVGSDQVSVVLPEAVSKSSSVDNRLSDATLPIVEQNIRDSVLKNPKVLADALFPVIGPAIRKAISTALSSMVQSFNQTLEYSVSPKGLKWRLEAARTGRSFGEVVMLKTLQYRVEQVFLIHRETGLLLQHVSIDPDDVEDADMVGAMLTAITDFAQDSFDEVDPNATLDSFKISGLQVWVENTPDLILAGVIRGNPPVELRETFFGVAEDIQIGFEKELHNYEGNSDAFESARPALDRCLVSRSTEEDRESGLLSPANLTFGVAGLVLLLVCGYFAWDYWKWTSLLEDVRNEPGYVLTDYERGWFTHSVMGLKDPLASDDEGFLSDNRYDASDVRFNWREYQDSGKNFVLERARKYLNPPKTVELRIEGTRLIAKGDADLKWVERAKRTAPVIAGVDEFVLDVDEAALISKTRIDFRCGTLEVANSSQMNNLSELISSLAKRKKFELAVVGFANSVGDDETNALMSSKRAELISDRIKAHLEKEELKDRVIVSSKANSEYVDCKVTFEVDPQEK